MDCSVAFAQHLADRALAGLNRVMEQGVEPLARLIWAPSPSKTSPSKTSAPVQSSGSPLAPDRVRPATSDRAPLREPPITADPLILQEPVIRMAPDEPDDPLLPEDVDVPLPRAFEPVIPLPPDLPPPLLLDPLSEPDQIGLEQAPPPPLLPPLPPASRSDQSQLFDAPGSFEPQPSLTHEPLE